MKVSEGNDKLGDCLVISRLVGLTCPADCFFLNNGCYAQKTEKRYGHVAKPFAADNTKLSPDDMYALFERAIVENKAVRLQERGDFYLNDKLDIEYVSAIKTAAKRIVKKYGKMPKVWAYTHIYDSAIAKLSKVGIVVYASVHNEEQYKKAKKAGFKLFAWVTDIKKAGPGRKPEQARAMNNATPKVVYSFGEKFIVCPEQRRGRDTVTCCGNKGSLACNMCVNGLYNVGFMQH